MILRVKKLSDKAKLPRYMTAGAACADLSALYGTNVPPYSTVVIKTGLAFEVPYGFEVQIRTRSGMAMRDLVVANSPGTIDCDYRGEICVLLRNLSGEEKHVSTGERIAQMSIKRVLTHILIDEVEELSDTDRGDGGFGSTGRY
jgi:dUTP pyrophosphatase